VSNFKETIGHWLLILRQLVKQGQELIRTQLKKQADLAVLGEVDRQEAMKATLAIQSAFKQNTEELISIN
jgi:hypothetical protein